MADSYQASATEGGAFDPAAVAAAVEAGARALHGDEERVGLARLVEASLQGELDRISGISAALGGLGHPVFGDIRLGAFIHDCVPGTHKPWGPPPSEFPPFNKYWTCMKDPWGCYHCFWIEFEWELA